ncbi:prlC [Wigglesworthia glossinidia endosymbiont of Glossina brevipalpis]|uniref:oligopeptidase A n=1 Tax=Wigglesworthia glossinidia brevipalpis TaxID=36870 RepID=Q8D2F6_WIGBR|nr:prlC [Wigglesworthia glossinidia endosymbiont of Glossina brevipalpis]
MINFLKKNDLPKFSLIKENDIIKIIESAIKKCKNSINTIVSKNNLFSWDNLCQPISELDNYLNKIWSPISNLYLTCNTIDLRKSYEKSLILISEYSTWVGQNKKLYKAFCSLKKSSNYLNLNIDQKKHIDNIILDFKLSGINLEKDEKIQYSNIIKELSSISTNFNNNILDSNKIWNKHITCKEELNGIPKDVVDLARENAKKNGKKGWIFNLDYNTYSSIINYCENENLRKEIYYAYHTRASDQNKFFKNLNNGPLIQRILLLKSKLSKLLGFKNYAEKSLVNKMAESIDSVEQFIYNLYECVKKSGLKEIKNLHKFAKEKYNFKKLNPWDMSFFSEKQKKFYFFINEEKLREFFPEDQVLIGLFNIVNCIYGIEIIENKNIEVWNPEVKFFEIYDKNKNYIGGFYLDLYSRKNKKDGAWMDSYSSRMLLSNGEIEKPISYIICNFRKIKKFNKNLLLHREVLTLFHEFGHNLHHVLTRINSFGVSGINGVPWDVVEFPSQLMENYCWDKKSIKLISKHYKSEKSLTDETIQNLIKTKNYQFSLFVLRQIEFSLFDLKIHTLPYDEIKNKNKILDVLDKIRKEISVFPRCNWERFPNTFSHIFSGGYSAGYYSYLWSSTMAIDAWSKFKEIGILNEKVGKLFLDNILSKGGSEDPLVLFSRFRGRKPKISHFIKYYGIR